MKSPKYSFTGTFTPMAKSLALSLLGALATWIAVTMPDNDFGIWTPFIGALAPLIANAINEFIKERK